MPKSNSKKGSNRSAVADIRDEPRTASLGRSARSRKEKKSGSKTDVKRTGSSKDVSWGQEKKSGKKDSKVIPRRRNSQMMEPSSKKKSVVRDVSRTSLSTCDVTTEFYKKKSESSLMAKPNDNQSKRKEPSPSAPVTAQKPTNTPDVGWKMIGRSKPKNRKPVDYHELMDRHFVSKGPTLNQVSYWDYEIKQVTKDALKIFKEEPVLIDVKPPYVVVGDIHGQFNDLINMFLLLGRPPKTRYLFLGDYVDRGQLSIETIMLLLCYKIYYPQSVILLRGNHECSRINRHYGFLEEVKSRYVDKKGRPSEGIWSMFQEVFNEMPICALIGTKIFCMHGGISPNMTSLDELRNWPKPIKNPSRGVINDLLWSDPDSNVAGFRNSARGSGFVFGEDVVEEMCRRLKFEVIIRAHQLQLSGYMISPNMRVITLFSAPNYCAQLNNAAAVLNVTEELEMNFILFVPETEGCRNRIQLQNKAWDERIDSIIDVGKEELIEERQPERFSVVRKL